MNDKTCEACGTDLVRRARETRQQWDRRRFCSQRCFGVVRSVARTPRSVPVGMDHLRGAPPTPREMQVVRLVARGMTNAEIGAELGLSPLSVKSHLARIAVKFGTGDRAGIVGVAIRRGLLLVPVTGLSPAGFDKPLFDVLVRIAGGRTNPQIAADLALTREAVKRRVRRLLALLGVSSREEAVVAGVACGALPLVRRRDRELVAA